MNPLLQKTFILILCLFTFSCASLKKQAAYRSISKKLNKSSVFINQFTGFALYDPTEKKFLKRQNESLLFTPASNTKILTAYAALTSLPDSLPAYYYKVINDTLRLVPLGDPTILHPEFSNDHIIQNLSLYPIKVLLPNNKIDPFGPGWAWDDFQYSFQNERSWFPVYGNEVRIIKQDSLEILPSFFENYIQVYKEQKPGDFISRSLEYNLFNVWVASDSSTFERKIPFVYSYELAASLLADTTHQFIQYDDIDSAVSISGYNLQYSQPTLSIVALMMQQSDNFLAEQLLIQAGAFNGFLYQSSFRNKMLQDWKLSQKIKWVDGSGLSRYNLISPKALVEVLDQLYNQYDFETLSQIFPNGGQSGTLKNWYRDDPPYVIAKTGTLSNNHNLSGYIKTKSGRVLIFSFMNNHYLHSHAAVKNEMEVILKIIRDKF